MHYREKLGWKGWEVKPLGVFYNLYNEEELYEFIHEKNLKNFCNYKCMDEEGVV